MAMRSHREASKSAVRSGYIAFGSPVRQISESAAMPAPARGVLVFPERPRDDRGNGPDDEMRVRALVDVSGEHLLRIASAPR
jgi:hypothetical protein